MELLVFHPFLRTICLLIVLIAQRSAASFPTTGRIYPELAVNQNGWIDKNGLFLLSNNSNFAFGFSPSQGNASLFLLAIVHLKSSRVVWAANRGTFISSHDNFFFDKTGNAYLEKDGGVVWSTGTAGKGVTSMELQDSGNLVLLGQDFEPLWQSFSNPTDTLLSNQVFSDGMRLVSEPNLNDSTFYLEMKSGEVILYGGFQTPQPYWSSSKEYRKTINKENGVVTTSSLVSNSWRFFDHTQSLVSQFIFSDDASPNITWAAVLGDEGLISFYELENAGSADASPITSPINIPEDKCKSPRSCDPYYICKHGERTKFCNCPPGLSNYPSCNPWTGLASPCTSSKWSAQLLNMGDEFYYFALGFASPYTNFDLEGCMDACASNCSCLMLFFESNSGNCFLIDEMGGLQLHNSSSKFLSYVKLPSDGQRLKPGGEERRKKNRLRLVLIITATIFGLAIILLCLGCWYHNRIKREQGSFHDVKGKDDFSCQESREYDNFLGNLPHFSFRFSYKDLQIATNNFSVKLGQGGFGSVYKGMLPDGIQIAVKKLEGIGQGKKEFKAEVTAIGGIHHIHLVKLKGFCIEGTHRLLAYDYMANGSLDRWIFRKNEGMTLDWETRFNIIVGVAKGLSYLHEGCTAKIIHCDIKPENVLLDDNFQAKVSDFGLAKLMTREQSRVVTILRGTRGYLAPEWITTKAISEKSDVYSFGMVLLEIVGGRRNFNPAENSEKAHLPSYALKMMEEGKLREILDSKITIDEDDKRVEKVIKVALCCIQRDMSLRPSMGKIVQMLEDSSCPVAEPRSSSQTMSHFFGNFVRRVGDETTSPRPLYCYSDGNFSAVKLSGPR